MNKGIEFNLYSNRKYYPDKIGFNVIEYIRGNTKLNGYPQSIKFNFNQVGVMNRQYFMKRFSLFFIFNIIILLFLISCATNPVTGKKELSLMSYNDEIRIGREVDRQIVAIYGLYYEEPEVAEYANQLGQMLAKISHRPFLEFNFRVLDSPVINAFALPGGYVYITRGLLAYMNSEAELAGVMGHEIGHITARHAASQYTKAQLGQLGFGLGSIFFPPSVLFSNVAQFGVGLLFLRFSRDHERQADSLGVEYSSRIGYDATHMANFFATLQQLHEQNGQDLPGWLSTHPNPEDREIAVLRMAKNWRQNLPPFKFHAGRDHYLDVIDGIVFGEEPRQGFVENGYFYHPLLDFQFPIPKDWQLFNTPQQVRMVNKRQSAVIQLTLAEQPNAKSAAEQFVMDNNAQVIYSENTKLNGYNTEIRETIIKQQLETYRVLSYFIEKDGRVYVFQGISRQRNYKKYLSTFKYSLNNFDRLKYQKAKNIKPTRIKIVKVTKSSALKDFLAHHPNKELSDKRMAILNGMNLTDRVQPGDRIKILTK